MVTNLRYLEAAAHDGGRERRLRPTNGDPAAVARRVARATKFRRHSRPKHPRAGPADGHIDRDGRPHRHRQDRERLRRSARRGRDEPRRRPRPVRATAGVRDDGRTRRLRFGRSPRSSGRRRRWCSAPGSSLAAGLGWLLARMHVAMLQHVFDPSPDSLAIPWGFLGTLAAAAIAAAVVATGLAAARSVDCPSARYCGSSEGNGALRTSRSRIRTAGE